VVNTSFGLNGDRQSDVFKHARKQVDLAEEDQVIDGTGIGDHQPHG
jgi:hypothetical protein